MSHWEASISSRVAKGQLERLYVLFRLGTGFVFYALLTSGARLGYNLQLREEINWTQFLLKAQSLILPQIILPQVCWFSESNQVLFGNRDPDRLIHPSTQRGGASNIRNVIFYCCQHPAWDILTGPDFQILSAEHPLKVSAPGKKKKAENSRSTIMSTCSWRYPRVPEAAISMKNREVGLQMLSSTLKVRGKLDSGRLELPTGSTCRLL